MSRSQLNDAFWKWFGDSKVVDESGQPMIVYHGSASRTGAFDQFKPSASTRGGAFGSSRIVRATTWFFTESKEMAYQFAVARADYGDTRTVYQVYLSIQNPLDATRKLDAVEKDLAAIGVPMADRFGDRLSKSTVWQLFDDPSIVAKLMAGGYDGAIISESDAARSFKLGKDKKAQRTWVAFNPRQIKSVNNRGTWDRSDPVMNNPQKYSSERTSIPQIAGLFKKWQTKGGGFHGINIDIGGGKYDLASEYLDRFGVMSLVYDPYNRSKQHNDSVMKIIQAYEGADSATIANVLNVIMEAEYRIAVIQTATDAVKRGGTIIIGVYEGDGSGVGSETSKGYQNNKKTKSYLPEVQSVLPNAQMWNGLIVAKKE
jgi:hypothetical protein